MDETNRIKKVIKITDAVSPTFCLAKWYHANIYLHTGQTHSCYHPTPHQIPLGDIKNNPSGIHNTLEKKIERVEMLRGKKPAGCNYCWNVESLSDTHISDRMIRNSTLLAHARDFQRIISDWKFDVNPNYVEISFSNECNFKCGYCHPSASSSYQSEIKQFGPYPTKNHKLDISEFKPLNEENNPYIDAFWKWWPEMSKTLHILRITGGEPLMHKSMWNLLDKLKEDPKPKLQLNINSNLGIKTSLVKKLATNVNELLLTNKIEKFKLFTSIDSWGPKAEYIRTGLNLELWEENLDVYINETVSPVTFMCTFNILSVTSFKEFLKKILEWRQKYNHIYEEKGIPSIGFDTPYLKEPLQYDMQILPKDEFILYFDDSLQFIKDNLDNSDNTKFNTLEFEKFRRVRDYFATADYPKEKIKEGRQDFYKWFTEFDKRRGTNFLETFPEMESFWNLCKLEQSEQ